MANRDFPPLKASSVAKRILALTQGVKLQNRNSYKLRTMLVSYHALQPATREVNTAIAAGLNSRHPNSVDILLSGESLA